MATSYQILRFDGATSVLRDYRNRQHVTKTKSGCLACKEKRVKCDEALPICVRCKRNGRDCHYAHSPPARQGAGGSQVLGPHRVSQKARTPPTTLPASAALVTTSPSAKITFSITFPSLGQDATNGTPNRDLMIHFCQNIGGAFQMHHLERILTLSHAIPLARSSILSLAACHLRHASDGKLEHRIAELHHQSRAIGLLQELLQAPRESLTSETVNGLLMSAMMLNMMALTLSSQESADDGTDPNSSWVYSDRDDRLDWLGLQAGIRPILLSVPLYIQSSIAFLSPIFMGESDTWNSSQAHLEERLLIVPHSWATIFEIERGNLTPGCETASTRSADTFRNAVIFLSELRSLKLCGGFGIFRALPFLSKVVGPFRTRLFNRDERAIWLFGYWLGLLCQFKDVWWCNRRAKKDYNAIGHWLKSRGVTKRPGVVGYLWKELMDEFDAASVV